MFDELTRRLEDAQRRFSEGTTALTDNGRPVYTPEEHDRRYGEAWTTYRAELRAVDETVAAAISAARQELGDLDGADTVMGALERLGAEDIQRAAALETFVRADYDGGDLPALARRAEAALTGGDRVLQLLHLRHGGRALERLRAERGVVYRDGRPVVTGVAVSEDETRLSDAVGKLAAAFADPAHARKRQAAEERIGAAEPLRMVTATRLYQLEEYSPRPRAGTYATARA